MSRMPPDTWMTVAANGEREMGPEPVRSERPLPMKEEMIETGLEATSHIVPMAPASGPRGR
ncbi:hypothetical protein [Streptosporangium sp. NPDC000396]|uniref:hypothetical protein n=1 Tax=Streptosporangium sp. NPDC000396 TaxID=3366185 RepID=UPI0036B7A7F4